MRTYLVINELVMFSAITAQDGDQTICKLEKPGKQTDESRINTHAASTTPLVLTLWTPSALHTAKLITPTPHHA